MMWVRNAFGLWGRLINYKGKQEPWKKAVD